jgi:phage tail sheath protein FI
MAEQILHGVEVSEITSGPRTIRTTKSSIIGLIGTAPDADNTIFPLNKPVLIVGSRREAAKLGTIGTLPMAINGIFYRIGAMVIVIRVEAGEDFEENSKFSSKMKQKLLPISLVALMHKQAIIKVCKHF